MKLPNQSECCGCAACASSCPQGAIAMSTDHEGFYIPVINRTKCINCGRCERTCPIENSNATHLPLAAFAVKAVDLEVRRGSASGGAFTLLAQEVIKKGGVVFGAGYEDHTWRVVHKGVQDLNALEDLRGSKYVQSDVGRTYQETKQYLESGRWVLYSGCPCQVAGLKSYLGHDYSTLLTVDLICHGVPSPLVWLKYIRWLEHRFSSAVVRVFSRRFSRWREYMLKVKFSTGQEYLGVMDDDRFLSAFLRERDVRKGCYSCPFRNYRGAADITIGDFWGVEKCYPELEDEYGLSIVMANTQKGKDMCVPDAAKIVRSVTMDEVCCGNNRQPLVGGSRPSALRPLYMFGVRVFGFGVTSACFRFFERFLWRSLWWVKRLLVNGEFNRF